ncbi:MAG: DUF1566 domain-containing protein [Nitrospinota bacterium]|nr:DUF1566 domain-containing protein [Nitrospinota bacterium]
MRTFLLALVFLLINSLPVHAKCSKQKVCGMLKKMDHFSILNACPEAARFLVECKKVVETTVEELAPPNFVDNGDGTVTDNSNKLVWIKKGILKKTSLKDAKHFARGAEDAGRINWRLPTLPELRTLIYDKRTINASGKKAWIHPVFDDGLGHYYWTTTTCDQVSVIEDRFQKKICQQGGGAAWLVHFNINAVFWHHISAEKYHIWLVADLKKE